MNPTDPAFPTQGPLNSSGMTKREYFAALALSGLLSVPIPSTPKWDSADTPPSIASRAVAYADALIKELSK